MDKEMRFHNIKAYAHTVCPYSYWFINVCISICIVGVVRRKRLA